MIRPPVAAVLLLAGLLEAGAARADDPAAAQALFTEAKKLMASGDYATACPKLEESERLAPAMGTKFNLADCYEHTGRIASAWAAFLSVAASAKNASQAAREKAARDRASALEPKLSRLAVVVPDATRVDGLEVKRDDVVVGPAEWGEAMPVDPGAHTIAATAPHKRAWKGIVEVEGNAARAKMIVPALEDEPAPTAPPNATPTPSATPSPSAPPPLPPPETGSSSTLGWVLVGAGAASIAGGVVFWSMRSSVQSRLDSECGPDQQHCPPSATDDIANGHTYTALSLGLLGLGVLGAGGGAFLLLSSGSSHGQAASSLRVVPGLGGARVVGTF